MSLPGLELTQPSEERHHVVAPPSQINLPPGSEWRFEVAFGHSIKVKVRAFPFQLHTLDPEPCNAVWPLRSQSLVIDFIEAQKTDMRYRSFSPARPSSLAPNSPNHKPIPSVERRRQFILGTAAN